MYFSRYEMRPSCVEGMTLAQFATHYSFTNRPPKKLKFDEDTGKGFMDDDSMMSSKVIFGPWAAWGSNINTYALLTFTEQLQINSFVATLSHCEA